MFMRSKKLYKVAKKVVSSSNHIVGQPQIPAIKPWPQRKRADSWSQVEFLSRMLVTEFDFCNIAKSSYLFTELQAIL